MTCKCGKKLRTEREEYDGICTTCRINEGGTYDATYKFGNTTVNVVAPPPMTNEEKERRVAAYHRAGWHVWQSLSTMTKIRLNAEATQERWQRAKAYMESLPTYTHK